MQSTDDGYALQDGYYEIEHIGWLQELQIESFWNEVPPGVFCSHHHVILKVALIVMGSEGDATWGCAYRIVLVSHFAKIK